MARKIHYAMMTQNELSDLIPNLEAALPYVDSITIVDGGSKDLTIPYMRNWSNEEPKIRFFINPWSDCFPTQRNYYLSKVAEIAQDGDWLLTADPDEYFEEQTFQKLHKAADKAEARGENMVGFQCRSVSLKGSKRVWENLDHYWKQLFIKWDPNFHYTGFKCHEGKGGIPHAIMNTALIYEHRKQENIIWLRGFRNLWHGGGGPNLGASNPIWVKLRGLCKDKLGIERWHDMYDYMLKGNIDPEVKQLFIDHMTEGMGDKAADTVWRKDEWDGSSEVRELHKTYFRMLHPEEEPEELRGIWIK